jgi:hypothetical protein
LALAVALALALAFLSVIPEAGSPASVLCLLGWEGNLLLHLLLLLPVPPDEQGTSALKKTAQKELYAVSDESEFLLLDRSGL